MSSRKKILLKLNIMSNMRDVKSFKNIYDFTGLQVRSLENLECNLIVQRLFLIPVLMTKILEGCIIIISRQFNGNTN